MKISSKFYDCDCPMKRILTAALSSLEIRSWFSHGGATSFGWIWNNQISISSIAISNRPQPSALEGRNSEFTHVSRTHKIRGATKSFRFDKLFKLGLEIIFDWLFRIFRAVWQQARKRAKPPSRGRIRLEEVGQCWKNSNKLGLKEIGSVDQKLWTKEPLWLTLSHRVIMTHKRESQSFVERNSQPKF